jgi:hypothetical protein
MSDLKELRLKELYAIYRHVSRHREQAITVSDQQAADNASWLLTEVKKEIRER